MTTKLVALGVFFFFTQARALCVVNNDVKLYENPGGKVQWVVPKYTPLIRLEQKGNWLKVEDQDGVKHWVAGVHVTQKFQCLSVKSATANLRTGPGAKFSLAETSFADRYTPFKRIDKAEDWYKVEDIFGNTVWINDIAVWRPMQIVDISY